MAQSSSQFGGAGIIPETDAKPAENIPKTSVAPATLFPPNHDDPRCTSGEISWDSKRLTPLYTAAHIFSAQQV